jgi:hypothetical protein
MPEQGEGGASTTESSTTNLKGTVIKSCKTAVQSHFVLLLSIGKGKKGTFSGICICEYIFFDAERLITRLWVSLCAGREQTREDTVEASLLKDLFAALTLDEAADTLYGFTIRQKKDPTNTCPQIDNIKPNTPAARRIHEKERILQINSTVRIPCT